MCLEGKDIMVPRCEVQDMIEEGAVCGPCSEVCCPEQSGAKIDMCLNGRTINVSRNACPGILRAGGTCGPCETVKSVAKAEKTTKTTKTVKKTVDKKE